MSVMDFNNDSIELVAFDARWPAIAAAEIQLLQNVLPAEQIVAIEHVGSTAIPGMLAKPVIDIQIAVKSLSDIKPIAIKILHELGYVFWRDNADPERLFFAKGLPPYGKKRTHHVHIVEKSSHHWVDKILFRDYLIAHSEVRGEYIQLKKKLAKQYANDREQYTERKTDFIKQILSRARQH